MPQTAAKAPRESAHGSAALQAAELLQWAPSVTLKTLMAIRRKGSGCEWGAIQLPQNPPADGSLRHRDPAVLCFAVPTGRLKGGGSRGKKKGGEFIKFITNCNQKIVEEFKVMVLVLKEIGCCF